MSHAALDDLANANAIVWPDGVTTKAEKAEVLAAEGVEAPSTPVYRLSLKESYFDEGVEPTASFMAAGRAVNLNADNPTFETEDRTLWHGLRDLPFLEDEGEVS